ncbi:tartrate dehydrogenase [Kyrpidia sp.]|uniref:tartrate dehydrogenase n=1 Tax=Kyrpidia sp. TaxID=2073077 RepID=UPI00179A6380|nr:tartrate dehydrogenase [Kyrpidia sp.]MCL6575703.1 tartrate dehydrogenase [Kyrpidia sp.]HHY66970.1 tartrate dehydrogenase [Alicyclobacillus sp.]
MDVYTIAVIPGDGIGREVVPAAVEVLKVLAEVHGGFHFKFQEFPWSCDYYAEHGEMMPPDGLDILKGFDAIFLGAVGNPGLVPDHISLWGLLLKIRREFEQVINVRPAKALKGVASPLTDPQGFDLVVVRENSEGEYSEIGGRLHRGDDEMAIQAAVFTRKGTERVMRYAFELARTRRKHVTSATKSNGIYHTMPFWDEVFKDVQRDYRDVRVDSYHIDALAAQFVARPYVFDVVVASNLFGDILTDISGAVMGSIGIAPAANINVNGRYPSMFEPVHGSAPDIAGRGIANPIGQIWTGALMLEHFGHRDAAQELLQVMEDVTAEGIKTPDIGGHSGTRDVSDEICRRLRRR